MTTKQITDTGEIASPKLVISFEKKIGLPNYGNETCFLSLEVDVPIGADLDAQLLLAKEAYSHVKAQVYRQLNILYGADETGIVLPLEPVVVQAAQAEAPPKRDWTKPKQAGAPRPAGPRGGSKDDLWRDLNANPKDWWDNRATKTGKQPDFKHKTSGEALWLSSAPEWFTSDEEPF